MPRRNPGNTLLSLALAGAAATLAAQSAAANPAHPPDAGALGALQIPFVANHGRYDDAVAFSAATFAGTVYVTRAGEIVHDLPRRAPGVADAGWTLVESLAGAMPLSPRAADAASARVSRFDGADAAAEASYRRVVLGEAWNGIDVWLQAHADNVEKFFSVRAGADAAAIRVALRGANALRAADDGRLVAVTDAGEIAFSKPVAFQEIDGARRAVDVAYTVRGDEYGFALGDYDRAHAVTIDPVLQSTFLGGNSSDNTSALAVHPFTGQIYVGGTTASSNFPGTAGGARPYFAGNGTDFVVARLSSDLATLLQATYLGRPWIGDTLESMVIHPATGDVYVAGTTEDTYFPGVTGGAQPASGGGRDAVVARLNADLTVLHQSTFLGGSRNDYGRQLAIAPATGDVYLAGDTYSANLPGVAGGAKTVYKVNAQEWGDAFVARFNPALTTLVQSTYVGGARGETVGAPQQFGGARTFAFHPLNGDIYLAGVTGSFDLPSPVVQDVDGWPDVFVMRINPQLTTFVQSVYFGGNSAQEENVTALAIDPLDGDVVIAGGTKATAMPNTAGTAQPAIPANPIYAGNGYVARLSSDFSTARTTFIGGRDFDEVRGLAIDPATRDVFVVGRTWSRDLPGRYPAELPPVSQPGFAGGEADGFITRLDGPLTTIKRTTYLGGPSDDRLYCVAIHPFNGEVIVAGDTQSTTFPAIAGGARTTHGGSLYDMVLSRLTKDL